MEKQSRELPISVIILQVTSVQNALALPIVHDYTIQYLQKAVG